MLSDTCPAVNNNFLKKNKSLQNDCCNPDGTKVAKFLVS